MSVRNVNLSKYRVVFILCFCFLAAAIFANAESYLLGPGDVLKVTVYDHEEMTSTVRVADSGDIILPLIGKVAAANITLPQLTNSVTSKLSDGYIVNPQVNIFITEFRSKRVVVLGNVNNPGIYELSGPISFLELVSKAGGLTKDVGDSATVKRDVQGKNKVISIDLDSLIEGGDVAQNIQIRDGDTVYISKAGMCFATGEVKNPGSYACDDNTTVLKLIALAGGFTGKASESSVKIVREIQGEKKVLKDVDLSTSVQTGDVIVVPESFF